MSVIADIIAYDDLSPQAKVVAMAIYLLNLGKKTINMDDIVSSSGMNRGDVGDAVIELKRDGNLSVTRGKGMHWEYELSPPHHDIGYLSYRTLKLNQSANQRRRRLRLGSCPVHGRSGKDISEYDGPYIVECQISVCKISWEMSDDGKNVLMPEYGHLLAPSAV